MNVNMKRLITICYLLSVTYSLLSAVRTSYGAVEGVHQDGVMCYLGIPYAQPPLGELAGRYPVAPTPWDTVLIADHGRQNEVQPHNRFSTSNMSQDCLYMNVFVPDSLPDSCPVMVWIHGGAYNTGGTGVWSSGHLRFDMSSFARETRTIVVTFNYRLNVFGYLNLHALNPRFDANIGTADQLFALQFVHEQIAAFGGDSSQICLFGQSAGGASVLTLMSLPEAQGLFARAIAMSPCLSHCYTPAESEQRTARFLRCAAVGKQHADKVLTLSDKRLANTGRHFVAQTALSGDVRCAFGPWVDGELIREMPAVGAARCTRPLLIGQVRDEARLFTNMVPKVLYRSFANTIRRYAADNGLPPFAVEDGNDPYWVRFNRSLTDYMFGDAIRSFVADYQGPVLQYLYAYETPQMQDAQTGCYHSADLQVVFGWTTKYNDPLSEDSRRVSSQVRQLFSRFAYGELDKGQQEIKVIR